MEKMKSTTLTVGEFDRARSEAGAGEFEAALVRCRTRLFRVAVLMVGSGADAEDVTQKTLLKAWQSRSRFDGRSNVYTWLYRILVNVCKDGFKSRARAERWLERRAPESEPRADLPSAETLLEQRERDTRLRRALGQLAPRWREVLVLRHFEELSYEEIAAMLDCPVGTVRSRLSTARARLRAELTGGPEAEMGGTEC